MFHTLTGLKLPWLIHTICNAYHDVDNADTEDRDSIVTFSIQDIVVHTNTLSSKAIFVFNADKTLSSKVNLYTQYRQVLGIARLQLVLDIDIHTPSDSHTLSVTIW